MPQLTKDTRSSPPGAWQTIALGMLLASQAVLLGLLYFKVLGAESPGGSTAIRELQATAERITSRLDELAEGPRVASVEEPLSAGPSDAEVNVRERLRALQDRVARLDDDVAARDAQIRELQGELNEARDRVLGLEIAAKRNEERLKSLMSSARSD